MINAVHPFLPSALVSVAWLADHLRRVTVVDASWGGAGTSAQTRAAFLERHIPGAVFFDIDSIAAQDTDLPHMLPPPEQFAAEAGRLGIGDADSVVVYDQTGIALAAARVWWMFRAMGHERVRVLQGGLPAWVAAGHATAIGGAPGRRPARFTPRPRPDLVRDADDVAARATDGAEPIVDARAADRFAGRAPEPWPGRRSGHVPGAQNVPYAGLVEGGALRPPEALAAAFAAAGLDPTRPFTAMCGSGVTACVLALAAWELGNDRVSVYDGSWADWGLPGDRPVAVANGA